MPQLDGQHRGPLINVAAWITLVSAILFTASKVATKWRMVRNLQNDDIFMILAVLMAVGQSIAASSEVQSGLGQEEGTLSTETFDHFQKAAYVSQLFYVVTITFTKMAALQFLINLARPNGNSDWRRKMVIGTLGFIIVWGVVAVLSIAFQCRAPHTWDRMSGHCFNQLAFWIANAVVDITTQLVIGLAPIYLLFNLQLSSQNKRLAMVAFTPNLTTIPLTVLRVYYLARAYRSSDLTLRLFNSELITVIHTNYSIIASCMPFLKPLVDSLAIGLMTNDIRVPQDEGSGSRNREKINPFAILGGKGYKTRNAYGWTRFPKDSEYTSEIVGGKENNLELGAIERYGSRDRMVINHTRTTTVTAEPRVPSLIAGVSPKKGSSQDSVP